MIPGQRYITTSEPSLGLGHVLSEDNGHIEICFPAAEDTRTYAAASAPLIRVRFAPGDEISDHAGLKITVESVTEENDLLTYHGQGKTIHESDLLDSLSFIRPEKRLLAGLTDSPRDFDRRLEALRWNAAMRRSPARGYTGARIDLIPHQLSIVAEAANRLHPRVLLADEVGLGKTIEACLILHRLHLTGRADRILILVPEPLVHQWFVELLRRFNLLFAIFDEDRCIALSTPQDPESLLSEEPETNPFSDSQLILASTDFLAENKKRAAQAREAGFDLLIVDEAHHLEWNEDESSPAYDAIEALAKEIPSLLLLTATPQQLGPEGHFARLRLLDPDRYSDLDDFLAETESYTPLAQAVEALSTGKIPKNITDFTLDSPEAEKHLLSLKKGDESARQPLITALIDSFGTGRVLFRNTRERLTGFPKRLPILHAMEKGTSPYTWLAGLIKELPETEKILLITNSPDAAITIQEKLLEIINTETSLFHEELSMLERDRNAAYFQEPEGARILICSEIGSEGRNFQFARHLVLFGLPRDPEVLEQRIGRLDRIGQTGDIHIHIPYGKDSRSELQALWLHEALDVFSEPLKGATTLATTLLPELDALGEELYGEDAAPADPAASTAAFFTRSADLKSQVTHSLATGHDRLLELGAPPASQSEDLLEAIETVDEDAKFQKFTLCLFDHLGLDIADLSERSFIFKHGQRMSDSLSDVPEEGLSVTFDRTTALSREDLGFLTFDHPLFRDALSQLLDGFSGNAAFATWDTGKGTSVLLECAFVLETLAPSRLQLDRFLPPTLMRVIVDHTGKAQTKAPPAKLLQPGDARRVVAQEAFKTDLFPKMVKAAKAVADRASAKPTAAAQALATDTISKQIARLKDLASRNPAVSDQELKALEHTLTETTEALANSRVRLDSVRLILCR
ncbi:MAG: SNF2-related protein [Akkermansiaceae bacterium]|nr:SNF2-related protein [Akkermansiaceae bacterium]MDP4778990.1 SNF2-related protein [Akkermansiaceae bacterium]MDP4846592.1 SNF2-related protein [Akkermansiaceae bacterium]